ncbi:MAG TPA: helix-turn-helix domain-containing protein [Candidatus Saccharimonadales bacterium]|nr:helix-turn-helix domain-containing protein [Candidatus Saccharimonadales bacterium]
MANDMNNIVTLLGSLGIPEAEAKTYAGLLEVDQVSIRRLAAHTGINRGTTYDALKRLVAFGLVSVKRRGSREQYTAESPERIYELIRDKRRDLLDATNSAKRILPALLARKSTTSGRPLVRYYEDDEGIVTILKDVLQTCRMMDDPKYYAYSSKRIRQYLYRKFPQFTKRRIAEGIYVKVIAVGEGGEIAANAERKWLPNTSEDTLSSYTLIYGNKVAIISIAEDNTPYGVVIEDAGTASMQRLLFEQMWNYIQ